MEVSDVLFRSQSRRRHRALLWLGYLALTSLTLMPPGCSWLGELIRPSGTPVAIIAIDSSSGEAPLVVSLDGSKSYDPSGRELVDFQWSFGDGTTARGTTASHTYANPGKYEVELSVTGEAARTSTTQLEVTVVRTLNEPTGYSGVVEFASGDHLWTLRVVDERGMPIPGIQCSFVTDDQDGIALAYDPSGIHAPLLTSLGNPLPREAGLSRAANPAPRYAVEEIRELILHNWGTWHGGMSS
jgi:PKD repeat protein